MVDEKMNNPSEVEKVEDYYNKSHIWYNLFWSDRESLGMHFSFWEQDTRNHKEALINQYRVVQELLNQKSGDIILDAGCGIGGASLWFAQNSDAQYVGITLSSVQLNQARKHVEKRHLNDRVFFELGDFFKTGYENDTFDKIFCIESACYAYPHPEKLYKELHRILKPGGVLAIADGVLLRHPALPREQDVLSTWFDAWALSGGCTVEEVKKALSGSGFLDVEFFDKTPQIEPDVRKLGLLGKILHIPLQILYTIGFFSQTGLRNVVAAKAQQTAYDMGLFGYGVFLVHKSERDVYFHQNING